MNKYSISLVVAFVAIVVYFGFIKPDLNKVQPAQNSEINPKDPQKPNPDNGMVSINFDDGWESAYQKAGPILDRAGVKATFYIITQLRDNEHMTNDQILDLYAKGHEIGAHTQTHPDLTTKSEGHQIKEVFGSRIDLLGLGIKSVDNFAYPYGRMTAGLEKIVEEAGFAGGRTTTAGANDASTDKYNLKSLDVKPDTNFSIIQTAIDDAVKNKQWLILTFHRIDENQDATSISQSASSDLLRQVISYLKDNNIAVVTNYEALKLLH